MSAIRDDLNSYLEDAKPLISNALPNFEASNKRVFLDGRIALLGGDSRERLRDLPDNSIDAVVTDPPYALESIRKRFGGANAAPAQHGTDGAFARASRGFMGQAWDTGETAFASSFWAECFRVLKPGGYILAFSGSRTYHNMAAAIEAAGFEVRDSVLNMVASDTAVSAFLKTLDAEQVEAFFRCLDETSSMGLAAWVYGSGFPKNHSVSPDIDDYLFRAHLERAGKLDRYRAVMAWARLRDRAASPKGDLASRLDKAWRRREGFARPVLGSERVVNDMRGGKSHKSERGGTYSSYEREVTGHLTPEAVAWDGWGTAIKPAFEPIFMGRKPLEMESVAANVLKWGTGAINPNGCRVGEEILPAIEAGQAKLGTFERSDMVTPERKGRFPANVIHDGSAEVEAAFPAVKGGKAKPAGQPYQPNGKNAVYGEGMGGGFHAGFDEPAGSAARFFYSAKADGNDRLGSKHPTVKPVDLMRWLVRLVTRKGGTVLDPFAGTGTTGEAAYWEGCNAILIEREEAYQADIEKRMGLVLAGRDTRKRARTVAAPATDLPLFGGE